MSSVPILARLVLANNVTRWPRALLGILGIAVSVCLVVWIVRGYDAVAHGRSQQVQTRADRFDVVVTPPSPRMSPGGGRDHGGTRRPQSREATPKYVDPQLIEDLRKDPLVEEVVATVRTRIRVVDPEPAVQMGPAGGGMLVGTTEGTPPQPLARGHWLETGKDGEAVVSGGFGARYALKLQDEITIGGVGGELRLKVVGLLQASSGSGMTMLSPNLGDLYVTPATAEKINGYGGRVNVVSLILKSTDATAGFVKDWAKRTAVANPPVAVCSLRQQDDDSVDWRRLGITIQAQNATVLAFLAACFIIFATLNAGVRERLREYASLRAIAMSRSQLVAMVFIEAIVLALIGWGVGLLLARALLFLGTLLAIHLKFFQAGAFADYPLGWTSVLVSGACALTGALAAAVLPAWQAAKLKPLDILSGPSESRARKFPRVMVGIGLALIVVNPIGVLLANVDPFRTFFAKTYKMGYGPPLLGCGAMIVGLALVTPLVVRLIDAVFGPILAWMLRLDRRFFRQQLSGNLRRTVGTTLSLSAGLTLFVTVLVWGYSMLVPFTPDRSLPRMLVAILPAGVPESAIDEVKKTEGVVPDECLAMAVEQPRLTDEMLQSKPFSSVDENQQNLLVMGVEPQRAFAGAKPVLAFTFVQGDRETAARKLAEGRYCLVPDHFHTQTGLNVGDKFSMAVPNVPGKTVEYEIAGVVYIPGWNWFTKFSEIRRRSNRALAVVFADYNQVKADFKIDRTSFFWMNVDERVNFQEMEKRLTPLANQYVGVKVDIPGAGESLVGKQYVKITERADLIERLNRRADDVIWSLTRFPLLALVIASLAVFNAVFASVRARFWQFGVLRGVGMSRGQLFRLVISESLMIFLVAGALSLASGILLAWCGTHICTYFFFSFDAKQALVGRTAPLVLPWTSLALGFGIAFGLCLLAGLIAAWQAAREEPLRFIQAGRTAL